MDSPVYKLEQVVQSRGGLEDFEGPLDLILFLLSKNKIEIQDIPIALILDQYLEYLELRKRMDLEIASEFIAMAAQLMFIKSRMLLSLEDEEAQSEMDELIKSLEERKNSEIYERIKRVVQILGPMSEFGRNIMTKNPECMNQGRIYEYDYSLKDLMAAYHNVGDSSERITPPPLESFSNIVSQEPYPVAAKANEILDNLKALGQARFHMLFHGNRSRSEVVATFVAVLELCKNRMIHLSGSDSDCAVTPAEGVGDTLTL